CRRHPGKRTVSILDRTRPEGSDLAEHAPLDRIRKTAGAIIKSPPRDRCDTSLWKSPAPERVFAHHRASTGFVTDLRRFLHAGQFRLRAVSVPGANGQMDVSCGSYNGYEVTLDGWFLRR